MKAYYKSPKNKVIMVNKTTLSIEVTWCSGMPSGTSHLALMQTLKVLACYRDEKIEVTGEACLRVWMIWASLSTVYAQNPPLRRRAFVGPLGPSFLLLWGILEVPSSNLVCFSFFLFRRPSLRTLVTYRSLD